jgi:hypothetical protein
LFFSLFLDGGLVGVVGFSDWLGFICSALGVVFAFVCGGRFGVSGVVYLVDDTSIFFQNEIIPNTS